MHKARYNTVRLSVALEPAGPFLIKAGGLSGDPTLPDMQFVRTASSQGETPYVPGASVKGVLRSFTEQALRTIGDKESWRWACTPLPSDKESCAGRLKDGERDESRPPAPEIYRRACGACRLFGHTHLRGRLSVTDLLAQGRIRLETRYGVAISRRTHAVAAGPFETEVALAGRFTGRIVLENFELWQLALLAMALDATNAGVLRFGFGKNRGYGEVRITVEQARWEEAIAGRAATGADGTLRGVGEFLPADERAHYGVQAPDRLDGLPTPIESRTTGLARVRVFDAPGWGAIAQKALDLLAQPAGTGR